MQIGEKIGPDGTVEVLAVANIGGGHGVFLGKHDKKHGPEFIVSTFTFGQKTWHSGFYTLNHVNALSRFIGRIDDTCVVFQP